MLLNNLLENLILPLGDLASGGSFLTELKKARHLATQSSGDINKLSIKKLELLLKHATTHAPFYAPYASVPQAKHDPEAWLHSFPILDKKILRHHTNDLLTMPKEGLIKCASSGSTGFQSITYLDKKQRSTTRAVQTLWWEWAGYKLGAPILQTGITPNRGFEKKIKDSLFKTYYLQAFSHNKAEAISALTWAQKQNQPVLGGYASSLYVLATMALELGIEVTFKTAITWGDKLFDHYRSTIEKAFGCKTFETYGAAEGFMMAGQADLEMLYQMSPYIFMEILDDNGKPVPDGQMGNVVVTNLDGFSMPMIRYKIGDLAIKLPQSQYPLQPKFQFPILQKVVGRDTDLVKTASGKYLVVHSFTGIFEHLPQISQFCVIQNQLSGITIEYIPGQGFEPSILQHISEKILGYLQEPFDIQFKEVENIPPTKSGKPQLIISNLTTPPKTV